MSAQASQQLQQIEVKLQQKPDRIPFSDGHWIPDNIEWISKLNKLGKKYGEYIPQFTKNSSSLSVQITHKSLIDKENELLVLEFYDSLENE